MDSPSWIFTSATTITPLSWVVCGHLNVLGYHAQTRILGVFLRQGQRNTPLFDGISSEPSNQPITPSTHESSRDRKRRSRARAGAPSIERHGCLGPYMCAGQSRGLRRSEEHT